MKHGQEVGKPHVIWISLLFSPHRVGTLVDTNFSEKHMLKTRKHELGIPQQSDSADHNPE